jgi:hypothetical protein
VIPVFLVAPSDDLARERHGLLVDVVWYLKTPFFGRVIGGQGRPGTPVHLRHQGTDAGYGPPVKATRPSPRVVN